MISEVMRLSRVTYRENDNIFLRDFDLDIREGEILGLMPLNWYGLPALLQVMQFNPPLYYGTVRYLGKTVNSWRDMKRSPNPITVVDNESSLVTGQSVQSNIFMLGRESRYFIHEKQLEEELRPYLEMTGVEIATWTRVEELTAFERVVVEIIRGMIWGHRLIVLREVSAYIGENNLEKLFGIMDGCRKKGISFLFISSHFEEIEAVCDRTALMSNGRILMKMDGPMTRELLERVWNKEYRDHASFHKNGSDQGQKKPVLEVRALEGKYFGRTDIRIYGGEYLVLHVPELQVYDELVHIFFGDEKELGGQVLLEGKEIDPLRTREIALLRANAETSMLFMKMSYMDNLLFTSDHRDSSIWRREGVKKSIRQEYAGLLGEDVFDRRVDTLSKSERIALLYTRILLQHPKVVFCEMPFRDVNPGLKLQIRDLQKRLNENGIAVVVMTMNMNESILEPDRVVRIGDS